jgi:hypothetical protein
MNQRSILPILAVLPILVVAPLVLPVPAMARDHAAYLASVATYKPMAGFNHVVGNKRFVGYFLAAPDLCRVTVFQAMADDEALVVPPRRLAIDIKAADRAELDAGEGAALAIACTADADAIKIAPQPPAAVGVRPRPPVSLTPARFGQAGGSQQEF